MPSGDSLQRLRALPRAPAPNDDAATVKSNLPHQDVELLQNILAYHVAHRPGSSVFGNSHANRLRLTEADVRPRQEVRDAPQPDSSRQTPGTQKARPKGDELEAVTVCEIVVEEGRSVPIQAARERSVHSRGCPRPKTCSTSMAHSLGPARRSSSTCKFRPRARARVGSAVLMMPMYFARRSATVGCSRLSSRWASLQASTPPVSPHP